MKDLQNDDVYEMIYNASMLGNLGLFIGSGFTKAIMENNIYYKTYTWGDLLKECCNRLKVDSEILLSKGSYPEIASAICKQYANNVNCSIQDSIAMLKDTIAELVNIYPSDEDKTHFRNLLDDLDINWIVTTNYDTILENIFTGKSLSIGPTDPFIKINGLIPIYHIHGLRTDSSGIVITNGDYVSQFRPNDYRQARLPFLIKESTVLMVGYGLGDINVVTALDWCRNVYRNISKNYSTQIIQLLYTDKPKDRPYYDTSGIIIVEVSNISSFFENLKVYSSAYKEEYHKNMLIINSFIKIFTLSEGRRIDAFIDNSSFRQHIIKYISSLGYEFSYIYNSYIDFLRNVIRKLDDRAIPNGAFDAYNDKLKVLLDILKYINILDMPPAFFELVANSLDSVAYYIGDTRGKSYAANDTWLKEKSSLPIETIRELKKYSEVQTWGSHLRGLLKDL